MGEVDICRSCPSLATATSNPTNFLQVLALAILGVFGIGYGKLTWQNRLLKKHQVADEERRMKISELQRNGQAINPQTTHEVPFGIRAIQRGIQIDGIWDTSIPLHNGIIPRSIRASSSEISSSIVNDPGLTPADNSHLHRDRSSNQILSSHQQSEEGSPVLDKSTASESDLQNAPGAHKSYKPKRSSHLRFGSFGELQYNQDTLDQLEGKPPSEHSSGVPSRDMRPPGRSLDAMSVAVADVEQSARSSSASLSNKNRALVDPQGQSLPPWALLTSNLPYFQKSRSSLPRQISKSDYFSIPLNSPENEGKQSYVSPLLDITGSSLPVKSSQAQELQSLNTHTTADATVLSASVIDPLPSPFVPGELHLNRATRTVNSGFQVLPAFTFGTPAVPTNTKGNGVDWEDKVESDEDKRQPNKLHRKTRGSETSERQ